MLLLHRHKLGEEFHRQVSGVLQQWESDLDKSKEQDEKLTVGAHGDIATHFIF